MNEMLKKIMGGKKAPVAEKEVSVTLINGEPEEEAEGMPGEAFRKAARMEDRGGDEGKSEIELKVGDQVITDFEEIVDFVMQAMKEKTGEKRPEASEDEEEEDNY